MKKFVLFLAVIAIASTVTAFCLPTPKPVVSVTKGIVCHYPAACSNTICDVDIHSPGFIAWQALWTGWLISAGYHNVALNYSGTNGTCYTVCGSNIIIPNVSPKQPVPTVHQREVIDFNKVTQDYIDNLYATIGANGNLQSVIIKGNHLEVEYDTPVSK